MRSLVLSLFVLSACSAPSPVADAGQPGSLSLWVPHLNLDQVQVYAGSRLNADIAGAPDVTLSMPPGCHPNALAFDARGDLWVTCNGSHQLLSYASASLQQTGSPAPKVTLDSDGVSLESPIGLVFDADGALWVAATAKLEFYPAAKLVTSGQVSPARTLFAFLEYPAALVFGAGGALWVSNASFVQANNRVLAFTPAQLVAAGIQVPQLELSSPSFNLVEGLAFTPGGELWVANNDGFSVARFSAADVTVPALAAVRAVVPVASLENDAADLRTVRKPGGLFLDASGTLYVNSQKSDLVANDARVLRYSAAQLAGLVGGQPVPASALFESTSSSPGFGGLVLH